MDKYELDRAASEKTSSKNGGNLSLKRRITWLCQIAVGSVYFWILVALFASVEPILCAGYPTPALLLAQFIVLAISTALFMMQLVGVAANEWDRITSIEAEMSIKRIVPKRAHSLSLVKLWIFFTAEGEYFFEGLILIYAWVTLPYRPGLAVLRCFRVFRILWFYEVEVFRNFLQFTLGSVIGARFIHRALNVLKFSIGAIKALASEVFSLNEETRGALLLIMLFFYSAYVFGATMYVEGKGEFVNCASLGACTYTYIRLTFLDGDGFDFAYDLTERHRILFVLTMCYLVITALGILNGLVGIFGSIIATASIQAFDEATYEREIDAARNGAADANGGGVDPNGGDSGGNNDLSDAGDDSGGGGHGPGGQGDDMMLASLREREGGDFFPAGHSAQTRSALQAYKSAYTSFRAPLNQYSAVRPHNTAPTQEDDDGDAGSVHAFDELSEVHSLTDADAQLSPYAGHGHGHAALSAHNVNNAHHHSHGAAHAPSAAQLALMRDSSSKFVQDQLAKRLQAQHPEQQTLGRSGFAGSFFSPRVFPQSHSPSPAPHVLGLGLGLGGHKPQNNPEAHANPESAGVQMTQVAAPDAQPTSGSATAAAGAKPSLRTRFQVAARRASTAKAQTPDPQSEANPETQNESQPETHVTVPEPGKSASSSASSEAMALAISSAKTPSPQTHSHTQSQAQRYTAMHHSPQRKAQGGELRSMFHTAMAAKSHKPAQSLGVPMHPQTAQNLGMVQHGNAAHPQLAQVQLEAALSQLVSHSQVERLETRITLLQTQLDAQTQMIAAMSDLLHAQQEVTAQQLALQTQHLLSALPRLLAQQARGAQKGGAGRSNNKAKAVPQGASQGGELLHNLAHIPNILGQLFDPQTQTQTQGSPEAQAPREMGGSGDEGDDGVFDDAGEDVGEEVQRLTNVYQQHQQQRQEHLLSPGSEGHFIRDLHQHPAGAARPNTSHKRPRSGSAPTDS